MGGPELGGEEGGECRGKQGVVGSQIGGQWGES